MKDIWNPCYILIKSNDYNYFLFLLKIYKFLDIIVCGWMENLHQIVQTFWGLNKFTSSVPNETKRKWFILFKEK